MININLGTEKNESIQHATIKNYLCTFLREKAEASDDSCNLSFISWRVNRGGPCYGVWKEYGFFKGQLDWNPSYSGIVEASDEKLHLIQEDNITDVILWEAIQKQNKHILYIADIAIQHKGSIRHVFEIIAFNPPSQEKLDFYKVSEINCFGVNSFKLYDILLRKGSLSEEDLDEAITLIDPDEKRYSKPCTTCSSLEKVYVIYPDEIMHEAKEICAICGSWQSKNVSKYEWKLIKNNVNIVDEEDIHILKIEYNKQIYNQTTLFPEK